MSKQSGDFSRDEISRKGQGHKRKGPWELWCTYPCRWGAKAGEMRTYKMRSYATEEMAKENLEKQQRVHDGYTWSTGWTFEVRYNENFAGETAEKAGH